MCIYIFFLIYGYLLFCSSLKILKTELFLFWVVAPFTVTEFWRLSGGGFFPHNQDKSAMVMLAVWLCVMSVQFYQISRRHTTQLKITFILSTITITTTVILIPSSILHSPLHFKLNSWKLRSHIIPDQKFDVSDTSPLWLVEALCVADLSCICEGSNEPLIPLCLILVNNQLAAQIFMYAYFYSLHVSGSHVPIIRRIIVSVQHLVYVTLCRWPSGMQVTFVTDGHLHRVT